MKDIIFSDFYSSLKKEINEIIYFISSSGLKSLIIETTRERAIERNHQKLNEFREIISSLWSFSIPFSRDKRSSIFIIKRNIDNYIKDSKLFLNEFNETKNTDIIRKLEIKINILEVEVSRLFDLLTDTIKGYDMPQISYPTFLYSIGGEDQLADLIIFSLNYAKQSLKILAPYIDETFTKILDIVLAKKKIDIQILIGFEPESKVSEILSNLNRKFLNFKLRINYDLHGRCIIMDEKYVFVHNTDFQADRRLGRIDPGIGVENNDIIAKALIFFDKVWNHGIRFQYRKLPVENLSKSVIIGKADDIISIKTETKMLLFNSDPFATYRDFSGKRRGILFGFIDSVLEPLRIYLDLNQISRKNINRMFLYKNKYTFDNGIEELIEHLRLENPPEIIIMNKTDYPNYTSIIETNLGIEIKDKITDNTDLIIFFIGSTAILFKEKKFTK